MTRAVNLADVIGRQGEGGLFGMPLCADIAGLNADIAILGVPTATPYPSAGAYCADAPAVLREASRLAAGTVRNVDFDLGGPLLPPGRSAVDCGDLTVDDRDGPGNRQRIDAALRGILKRGAVPVVLGGDDSVPIPVVAAFPRDRQLSILQIDAHIDWREEVRGERMGLSSPMRRLSEMEHVGAMVQIGRRGAGSATAADVADADAYGVHFFGARDFDREAERRAIEALPEGGDVVICFDVDGLDPAVMPAVIGRVPGGLSYWQAVSLIEACAARCRIAGFILTEFMPGADIGGLGALVATRILATAMGHVARQCNAT